MNASDLLLEHWGRQVKELFAHLHHYQQEALAFSVQSIVQSGSAVMQQVAEKAWEYLSCETKVVSHERRLQRFVANEYIEVEVCWTLFLRQVLPLWQNHEVTLILDLTPYHQSATIVYLGILVQSRVLPLAWRVMPQQEKWDEPLWDIVGHFLAQIAPLLSGTSCTLLADRGLSCLELIKLCEQVGWHYLLRIKQEEWLRRSFRRGYQPWQAGQQVIRKEGQQWYGKVLLWKEHQYATWLSACWQTGYEQAWLLISDRPAARKRVREYAKRMRVEASFQDYKSRGCLIECSRFTHREHLDRWLLAVSLAIWWMAHLGHSCMHHGQRSLVDRAARRDKGWFRIGRLWLKAILKKATRDLTAQTRSRVAAQLANCLPFFHRDHGLCFSLYLQ